MNIDWVSEYVSSVLDVRDIDRITAISRFEHGENHAVFRVSYLDGLDERDVVVRVSNSPSEAAHAQAEREAAALTELAGAVSPRILDFSTSDITGSAVMCLEYVPGHSERLDAASPRQMANLGATLRQVHATAIDGLLAPVLAGPPDLIAHVDERLQSMLLRMSLVRGPLPNSTQSLFHDAATSAEAAAARLRGADDPGPPVLLHGDVSSGNILWTPQPVLIDWEYVRTGDAADEIGYLFGQNVLRQEQRDGLWNGYSHEVDRTALALTVERATTWEPLTLFGSALYWIDLWSQRVAADATRSVNQSVPKAAAYYLDFAQRYLDRCCNIWSDRAADR